MIHVLYVDDEPDLLELGKRFLERAGDLVVDTAPSAHQALTMLESAPYDAIISDFQMPEMDGISFLKHIRAQPNEIPFILFTGRGREEIVIEALNNGADFYVQKGGNPKPQFAELHHKILQSVKRRESEEKFRILVEKSLIGVYIIQDDRFIHVNPRFAEIFGYSQEEILRDLKVVDLVLPEDRNLVLENLEVRLSNKVKSLHYTFRGLRRDRQSMDVEVAGTRALFHGQPIIVGTLVDVNGHAPTDSDLLRANRNLSILNNLTCHDIANRLTVLRGRLKVIRNQHDDPVLLKQVAGVDEATRAIHRHLETARIYQNIGLNSLGWQNVTEIITKELELSAVPNLKSTLDIADLEILADPLLNRVFSNLIENTTRHGTHATEIHVSCQKSAGSLTLIFEDNGEGISMECKERIFEQGFGRNTGMGLYLSKEILSGTGITITETGRPGKGVRFEISVPEHAWRITPDHPVTLTVPSAREPSRTQS